MLKKEFFKYNSKDYSIIAITYPNRENNNTWHLMDIDYIERFKEKQPVLQFGALKIKANDYPAYTKLVYHEEKGKRFVITPEKEKQLKEKKFNFSSIRTIANRVRLANFGEIWKIEDDKINEVYKDQLTSIKIGDEWFHSSDYRKEVFLVKNKMNNEKYLLSVVGKIVMKKN